MSFSIGYLAGILIAIIVFIWIVIKVYRKLTHKDVKKS